MLVFALRCGFCFFTFLFLFCSSCAFCLHVFFLVCFTCFFVFFVCFACVQYVEQPVLKLHGFTPATSKYNYLCCLCMHDCEIGEGGRKRVALLGRLPGTQKVSFRQEEGDRGATQGGRGAENRPFFSAGSGRGENTAVCNRVRSHRAA